MPHFITLEVAEGQGTIDGTATVSGIGVIDIDQGVATDLPHGTTVEVTAIPSDGWRLYRLSQQLEGQEETSSSLNEESSYTTTYTLDGNLTVKAYFLQIGNYSMRYELQHITVTGEVPSVAEGETLSVTLVPDDDYLLPENITVTMTNADGTAEEISSYDYDPETGVLKIDNVTGDIVISAVAIDNHIYTVTYGEASHFTYTNEVMDGIIPTEVPAGEPMKVILVPDSGYEILESNVTVTMGGTELSGVYSKHEDSSVAEINISAVTGNVEISVLATKVGSEPAPGTKEYTVTLPALTGATTDPDFGGHTVKAGESFSFRIILSKDYDESEPVVSVNGQTILPDDDGYYVITNVQSNLTVSITGIVRNQTPTGNAKVETDEVRVWVAGGMLHVYTPKVEALRVMTISGAVVLSTEVQGGDTSFSLPGNIYIVVVGGEVKKVSIR